MDSNSKIQAMKVTRNGIPNGPFNAIYSEKTDSEDDAKMAKFLYDLFWAIEDFGILVEMYLKNDEIYFSGNAHCGEIIAPNKIRFKDYEESYIHEMNFDEFLRVNKEYHELYRKKANDIWFKIINDKIILDDFFSVDNDTSSK